MDNVSQTQGNLANLVRRIYIHEVRSRERMRTKKVSQYMPGGFWDGRQRRKAVWLTIADRLEDWQVPVHDFVRHQFAAPEYLLKIPKPNYLLGAGAYERYKEGAARDADHFLLAREFQERKLDSKMFEIQDMCEHRGESISKDEAMRSALLDGDSEMSALFRYVLAVASDMSDTASSEFQFPAAIQYMSAQKSYDDTWGGPGLDRVRPVLEKVYRKYLEGIPGLPF